MHLLGTKGLWFDLLYFELHGLQRADDSLLQKSGISHGGIHGFCCAGIMARPARLSLQNVFLLFSTADSESICCKLLNAQDHCSSDIFDGDDSFCGQSRCVNTNKPLLIQEKSLAPRKRNNFFFQLQPPPPPRSPPRPLMQGVDFES